MKVLGYRFISSEHDCRALCGYMDHLTVGIIGSEQRMIGRYRYLSAFELNHESKTR